MFFITNNSKKRMTRGTLNRAIEPNRTMYPITGIDDRGTSPYSNGSNTRWNVVLKPIGLVLSERFLNIGKRREFGIALGYGIRGERSEAVM